MNISVEFNNKSNCKLSKKFIEGAFEETLRRPLFEFLENRRVKISVAAVSSEEIQEINKKYRFKDEITDILSFSDFENREEIEKSKEKSIFLGELIVCCSHIEKSAKIKGIDVKKEFAYILSHGVLHLLGFQHEEKMFEIQNETIKKLGI